MAKKKAAKKTTKKKTPPSKVCARYRGETFDYNDARLTPLSRAWEITDEAAEQLAQSGNIIALICLRKLSVKAARHLASSAGNPAAGMSGSVVMLCLDSLDKISNAALEALVEFQGAYMSLGLLELSDEQAEILSRYSANHTHQELALNGLSELTPSAASHLVQMAPKKKKGLSLILNGLQALSDETSLVLNKFGVNLKKVRYPHLELDGITALTPHAARCLTEIPGACSLVLGSVRELSVEACEHLASRKHTSDYDIRGLDSLSIEAAEVIAKAKCPITINVSRLSDEVIAVLETGGKLWLITDDGTSYIKPEVGTVNDPMGPI